MPRLPRQTAQKTLLRKELKNFDSFFTAEDLHEKVKSRNIGISTVYRFLKELKNKNEIHNYICDRKSIYSKNKNNHCHFICQKCGKLAHIDIDSLDFLNNKIIGSICHFQVDIEGVCKYCQNKNPIRPKGRGIFNVTNTHKSNYISSNPIIASEGVFVTNKKH
jgi:Fe2+ or Zn2+ uptake regulation protein